MHNEYNFFQIDKTKISNKKHNRRQVETVYKCASLEVN